MVIVNYSFTGIPGCLKFELEVMFVAWTRLGAIDFSKLLSNLFVQ